jgi:2-polyprenyl-6-methoxyphenol hydroxylase-like FAD-dependent oxidoreductase
MDSMPAPRPRVVVVGAGIGGLTTAIALSRVGCDVLVVERARTLAAVGAGISLWPSGLAALAEIGLEGAVLARGAEFASLAIRTSAGAILNKFDRVAVEQRLGGLGVMLHRADLQQVLVSAAGQVPIQLGVACERVTGTATGASLSLSDRRILSADLVVGADGLRSKVRDSVAPGAPKYTGLTSWRAVIDEDLGVADAWLSVGFGKQFLASPLPGSRTYVSGLLPAPAGAAGTIANTVECLRDAFRGWHDPIARLIAAHDTDCYWTDVYHRPPPTRLVWDRIVLIGDAAHPMTPDLGQGGGQAIEDAVALARCVHASKTLDEALRRFEDARLRRVRRVVRDSRRLGRLLATPHRPAAVARDLALRLTPDKTRLSLLAAHAGRSAFEAEPAAVRGV